MDGAAESSFLSYALANGFIDLKAGRMAFRDIVVVLPGISGSTLAKDGRPVWGFTASSIARTLMDGSLDVLTVSDETGEPDLGDGIVPGQLVQDVHIIPGLWKIDGYEGIAATLTKRLGLITGVNLLEFPYDWRRDNRVSAASLKTFVDNKLTAWIAAGGPADARAIFVAHSMGGLVARYYIECLEGWRRTRRLVTLGTPFRGSLNALGFLVNGMARKIGPFSVDATAPLRSFASVHQLLPTYPCIEVGGAMLRVAEADLVGVEPRLARDAARFHQEIATAQAANCNLDGYDPGHVAPVVSTRQPTFQSASLVDGKLALARSHLGQDAGGDGTVPLVSAVPVGVDPGRAIYVAGKHGGLQNQEQVGEYAGGLLHAATVDFDRFRAGGGQAQVQFDLDDAYAADAPIPLSATVSGAYEQQLQAVAVETRTGARETMALWPSGAKYEGELRLPAGAWRVTLSGLHAQPVSDIVLVAHG